LADGPFLKTPTLQVSAVENSHFHARSWARPGIADKSFAYRFDTPNGAVVFTGDTGPSDAVAELAKGADVLVSEVYVPPPMPRTPIARNESPALSALRAQMSLHMATEHLTPEDVGKLAAKAGVKMVILTHLVEGTDTTDMTVFTKGVQQFYTGPVIPGNDLLEYDLGAASTH
jgi:ribonuclease BN (tRNA processing enzyme)